MGSTKPLMSFTLALCLLPLATLGPATAEAASPAQEDTTDGPGATAAARIDAAVRVAKSDEELGATLEKLGADQVSTEAEGSHFLAAIRHVKGDPERGRLLRLLLLTAPINPATGREILKLASSLPDRDMAKVLSQMHEIGEYELVRGPLLKEYLDAAEKLHSSEDLSQALTELLHPYPIPESGTVRALELARKLSSDSERMRVLREVKDHQPLTGPVSRAYSAVVAGISNPGDIRDAKDALAQAEE